MTDQQPRYVANPNYADDSHRVVDNGYIKPPGVPLTEGRSHPGEQCAALGKAYNPGLAGC